MSKDLPKACAASDGLPSFIDFEASSLSADSYPIEVAWNLEDGSIESHLISPEGQTEWQDWSDASQAVHGIPRDTLLAAGKPAAWVAERMNAVLAGKTLYSDATRFDGYWLSRLFDAAEIAVKSFELGDAKALLRELICGKTYGPAAYYAEFARLQNEARNRCPRQHRAPWDVEYLMELFKLARHL